MKSKVSSEKINKMAVLELLKIREEIALLKHSKFWKTKNLKDIEEGIKDVEEGNVISFDDLVKELGLEDGL